MKHLPILVQRSAIVEYQRCPRARWYGYEFDKGQPVLDGTLEIDLAGGTIYPSVHIGGLTPNKPQFYFAVGLGVHKGAEYLLRRLMNCEKELGKFDLSVLYTQPWKDEIEEAISQGLEEFDKDILPYYKSINVAPEGSYDNNEAVSNDSQSDNNSDYEPEVFNLYSYQENRALTEALIRAWALAPQGLRWLVEEYEVLEVEIEITCPLQLAPDPEFVFARKASITELDVIEGNLHRATMMLMARPDAILRHRQTGGIYVWSLKTTKTWDKRKEKTGEYDVQGISELVAVEWWVKQKQIEAAKKNLEYGTSTGFNPRVSGIQMTYLLKGYSSQDKDGQYKTSNGLVRPYFNGGILDYEEAFRLKSEYYDPVENKNRRLGKGWSRVNIWDQHQGVGLNVVRFDREDDSGNHYLDQFVINPVPHYRAQVDVEEWLREVINQEHKIAHAVEVIQYRCNEDAGVEGELDHQETVKEWMASVFPKYRHSCTYPVMCSFIHLCHEGMGNSAMECGKYKLREANHPQEGELI